jgi:hypothetical protein
MDVQPLVTKYKNWVMKKYTTKILVFLFAAGVGTVSVHGQADAKPAQVKEATDDAKAKSDAEIDKKAAEWTASLLVNDAAKAAKVKTAIATHLKLVRDWHNEHPATLVPAGINPATGNKLSEMDRQIIAASTIPKSVHDDLMNVLKANLTPEQVDAVLDKYTIGKVDFTLKGYHAIVPDLTAEEEAKILDFLKQAREQAIDYKNMKEISAIFEIYKTKCEQYLNSNGRNWHALFKAYVDKVKKEKEAAKKS